MDDYIPLIWWMGTQQPSNFVLQLWPFYYFSRLKEMLLNFLEQNHFKVTPDLRAIETKNKQSTELSWYIASDEFNPWQNSDQHSHGNEKKTHHGYYFPFMFTLHFKGTASPTCHTLVNSLILTRMKYTALLCESTAKCPMAGWEGSDEISRKGWGRRAGRGRWSEGYFICQKSHRVIAINEARRLASGCLGGGGQGE